MSEDTATPPTPDLPPPPAATSAAADPPAADRWTDWPVKGSSITADQPWQDPDRAPAFTPRAGLAPLGPCSQGPEVSELAQRLDELGYPSSITKGTNPYGILDESVIGAVGSFRRGYGVRDDPSGYGQGADSMVEGWVGAWTAEAVWRASDRARAALAA